MKFFFSSTSYKLPLTQKNPSKYILYFPKNYSSKIDSRPEPYIYEKEEDGEEFQLDHQNFVDFFHNDSEHNWIAPFMQPILIFPHTFQ